MADLCDLHCIAAAHERLSPPKQVDTLTRPSYHRDAFVFFGCPRHLCVLQVRAKEVVPPGPQGQTQLQLSPGFVEYAETDMSALAVEMKQAGLEHIFMAALKLAVKLT